MGAVVVSNDELLVKLGAMRTRYNLITACKLYISDIPLDPSVRIVSFVQAFFPGYAPVDLTGTWGVPVIESLGVGQIRSGVCTFAGVGPGFPQQCYGWWIDDGSHVLACQRFAATPTVGPGQPPLSFVVAIQDIARSILP